MLAASPVFAAAAEDDRLVDVSRAGDTSASDSSLLGPLRIRDMTPFNLLRLDMVPAHAIEAEPGSFAVEADLSVANTFAMSSNVRRYLQQRGERTSLSAEDAQAIFGLGQDAFYMDGEFGLLEVRFHYRVLSRTSVYLGVAAYDFSGGFLDGSIEGFHSDFGFRPDGRDLVARRQFQSVVSLDGNGYAALEPPVEQGVGDPVLGLRHAVPLGGSRCTLVVSAEAKIAWREERPFLSTGTNDYGLQLALQRKFERQAVYATASLVSADGQVFGVDLDRRLIPTFTAAWEVAMTHSTNFIGQLYASPSTVRDTSMEVINAEKYLISLGVRSRYRGFLYGFCFTENIKNLENTPDFGITLSLAWADLKR